MYLQVAIAAGSDIYMRMYVGSRRYYVGSNFAHYHLFQFGLDPQHHLWKQQVEHEQ
jgi:hypothetical protein